MKIYSNNKELTNKLLQGVDILADNVATTLGPRGRNVLLKFKTDLKRLETRLPISTKDGATVAKFVDIDDDPIVNLGAQLVKQAAVEAEQIAGDGTTTATVLARSLFRNAHLYLTQGVAPIELKRGMEAALNDVVEELKTHAVKIRSFEDIKNIATVSANNDPVIGELVAKAVDLTGKDGAISVKNTQNKNTSLELAEGFRFEGGYYLKEFITHERQGACIHEDALFFITDFPLQKIQQLWDVLQVTARQKLPLVVVAPEIEGQALDALLGNHLKGTMNILPIKAGGYGEEQRGMLEDLAVITGAKLHALSQTEFQPDGTIKFDVKDLGACKKIEVYKNQTTVIEGVGEQEQVDRRVEELKVELKHTDNLGECERIQKRISRMASGIAQINVGGYSEVEVMETRHRVDDALEAVISARDGGLLPGGGVALLRVGKKLSVPKKLSAEQQVGYNVVLKSICEPFKQISLNSGESFEVLMEKLLKKKDFNQGYNFASNQFENLLETGIVDPWKVTTTALTTAISVVGTMLLTSHAIVEVE